MVSYLEGMTQQPQKTTGWFSGPTRFITVASIVAVGLAGAAAVSANVGILDAASDSDVGNVSVAGDLTPVTPQVVDVYLPSDTSSTTTSTTVGASASSTSTTVGPAALANGIQEFTVDSAGTVAVAKTATGLRLESVTPTAGWKWNLSQTAPTELMVKMTNGVRNLEFVAIAMPDGSIAASVNEPFVTQAISPQAPRVTSDDNGDDDSDDDAFPTTGSTTTLSSNDDEDDEYDDSDDEYEDSDDEYEDSEGEYEGGEDDD